MPEHPSLSRIDHRPWPLPAVKWAWRQGWKDLAFLHYRIDPAQVRSLLPAGVTLQTFDGSAWLGVVPFLMHDVMRGSLPALPWLSTFPELNVRTYVEAHGRPGVWFFSLDAASRGIVFGGRTFYRLPYHLAGMKIERQDGGWYDYSSSRRPVGVAFRGRYRPIGSVFEAVPGTFEHWAAERYCLYSRAPRGESLHRAEVHHAPWPLQTAEVEITRNDLLSALGLTPEDQPPVCHFSTGVKVISWGAEALPAV